MNPTRLIVLLLAAAWVTVDGALWAYLHATASYYPAVPAQLTLGLAFSQNLLLAAWLVWGPTHTALRLALTLCGLAGLGAVCSVAAWGSSRGSGVWFVGQAIYLGWVVMAFLLLRVGGWRLAWPHQQSGGTRISSRQFTLWGLMCVTTGAGLSLGAIQSVGEFTLSPHDLLTGVGVFGCLAAVAVVSLWSGLRWQQLPLAWAVALLGAVVGAWLLSHSGLDPFVQVRDVFLAHAAGIAASATVLRVAGCQLQPFSSASAQPATPPGGAL